MMIPLHPYLLSFQAISLSSQLSIIFQLFAASVLWWFAWAQV